MSKETHEQSFIEEEIKRYTTLSYRAPEMIDLFSGTPIGNFLKLINKIINFFFFKVLKVIFGL